MKLVKKFDQVCFKGVAACYHCQREIKFLVTMDFLPYFIGEPMLCDKCDPRMIEAMRHGVSFS